MKSNTTHTRVTAVGVYFWELECQVLSNIYSSYCYLSGVSGCLRNALCVLTQQTVIAECWLSTGYRFCFPLHTGLEELSGCMEMQIRSHSRAGHNDKVILV